MSPSRRRWLVAAGPPSSSRRRRWMVVRRLAALVAGAPSGHSASLASSRCRRWPGALSTHLNRVAARRLVHAAGGMASSPATRRSAPASGPAAARPPARRWGDGRRIGGPGDRRPGPACRYSASVSGPPPTRRHTSRGHGRDRRRRSASTSPCRSAGTAGDTSRGCQRGEQAWAR